MINNSYYNCINKLRELKKLLTKENELKKGKLYFSWIETKTGKIQNEKDKMYVYYNLVNFTLKNYPISKYTYNKLNDNIKTIIRNNYFFDGKKYFFLNNKISFDDVMILTKYIILKRGNVVWIDFGFNIGNEFGGVHPAIILKNLNFELFVLSVSSKKPLEYKRIEEEYKLGNITNEECNKYKKQITELLEFRKIFGFKNMIRFANITRIRKVSILRLNFKGSVGAITGYDLDVISEKIREEF